MQFESSINRVDSWLSSEGYNAVVAHETAMHGDLHSANIMLKQGVDTSDIEMIDYETFTFEGHFLIDCGELIEDLVKTSRLVGYSGVLEVFKSVVAESDLARDVEAKPSQSLLLLSRIRSLTYQIRQHIDVGVPPLREIGAFQELTVLEDLSKKLEAIV